LGRASGWSRRRCAPRATTRTLGPDPAGLDGARRHTPRLRPMRAAGMTQFGGPDVLHMMELPDPEAGRGEVRLHVYAAAVNPTDTQLRSGARAERLKDVPPPHVPGMDVAGVLERIGAGVKTDLRVGDRVMAIVLPLGARGGYAESVSVP